MLATTIYAISVATFFAGMFCLRIFIYCLRYFRRRLLYLFLRYLLYPVFLKRTWFSPPITRWTMMTTLLYWLGTLACNLIGVQDLSSAVTRTGLISVFNLVPLISFQRIALAADLFGLSLRSFQYMHVSLALMVLVQGLVHVTLQVQESGFDMKNGVQFWGLLVRALLFS